MREKENIAMDGKTEMKMSWDNGCEKFWSRSEDFWMNHLNEKGILCSIYLETSVTIFSKISPLLQKILGNFRGLFSRYLAKLLTCFGIIFVKVASSHF